MGLVYLKSYNTDKGTMIACCDEGLMGKTFRQGRLKISVENSFYGTSLLPLAEALFLLDGADILNLVGGDIIEAAIEKGIVHPDAVISIGGIPHVQVMRL
jgi:uncharacterized protein